MVPVKKKWNFENILCVSLGGIVIVATVVALVLASNSSSDEPDVENRDW